MNFRKVNALILAETILVGGILAEYRTTQQAFTEVKPQEEILLEEVDTPITPFTVGGFDVVQKKNMIKEKQKIEAQREQERKEAEEKARLEKEEQQRLEEARRKSAPHFNPDNVGELSNLSKEQISKMLEGTALHTLVNAYYWYEQEYQVNAVFLMALTAEESGWGRSSLAINNNNISGHKNARGEWANYSSWGECLEESFRLLGNEYIKPTGKFYTGASIYDINHTYCPDPENPNSWANNITRIGYELMDKLNK